MNLPDVLSRLSTSFITRVFLVMVAVLFATSFLPASNAHAAQKNLSWSAPTNYAGGAPIPDLIGYNIHIGTASGNYTQTINAGAQTSYTVANLVDGTAYYFAITAYDSFGNESGYSSETTNSQTVQPPSSTLYTIAASAGSGGSINPTGSVVISQGASQTFSVKPNTGYKIAGVTVDGASVGAVSSYTFSNVTANHTIAATFTASVTSYSITASAGTTGGSISPAGTATVNSGGSQAYTITPSTGYKIAGVTVDGVSAGAISGYTFSNVAANHTISATFSANTASANIPHTSWTLKYVDSQELTGQNGAATNAFDGQSGTIWHTQWSNGTPTPCPHEIQINLGKSYSIDSFSYLPRQDGGINGTIGNYEFYISSDGVNWGTPVATGTFANNTLLKQVALTAKSGQYIRLRALSEVNGGPWTSVAEINVTGK
jgi:F5/8 type C domain/Fibronectin type III domain/Divergent InlB B-repeat domain